MRPSRVVRLDPMTEEAFRRFLEEQVDEYASQKQRAGMWLPQEARPRARTELSWLLAGDRAGHRFLAARAEADGAHVADAWVGPPPEPTAAGRVAYVYQLTVRAGMRRAGWGRATMVALHARLAAEGFEEARLNVFRFNKGAIALYRALGYEPVEEDAHAMRMRRRL